MTLLDLFSRGRRTRASGATGDRSAALIFYLLLGLVFAPVIGLHVALAASDTGMGQPRDSAAHAESVPTRRHR
ncbi:MAG TPA: hypothetical protein VHN20_16625 [Beijerinckiaceae bacterium]|nr:hypothetical protein [Beijerinckiaceae bacterium]